MTVPRRHLFASVAATLLAALILFAAAGDGAPFGPDTALHRWVLDHRTSAGIDVATFVTDTGNRVIPHLLAALAGALTVPRTWWLGAVAGFAALLTGQLLRLLLVHALDRPRPPAESWTAHVNNPSMPSGHSTTAALTAIGLAAALLPYCHRTATRALAIAVPAAWGASVGLTRVYLGVHWPTDVLAGWLFAAALTLLVLPPLGRRLRRSVRPAELP
ncbi:phosphatase PAP2 family protein [Streptomyces johnsoniae]|uniref:Phosphatase PAP2 family protein n=1 Tax=Streptomyces johnsoniae TaxID=3075532 RepID=A0ABU2S7W5_9ACTN|nr:phosphatase PAP2 family protein [Streptomyces sp. DSM 41886]MDT0445067.1 phosphatase PAP2 family protein [Streptomyces sp. DSM 41886]